MEPIEVIDLGLMDYAAALDLQRRRVDDRARGVVGNALLVVEHPAVITLGRGHREVPPRVDGIPVVRIERGGDATYHGPGQVVVYPILYLEEGRRDLHRYLRDLEEAVIHTCRDVGVEAERREGYTGVWVAGKKVASIGVAVKRWVTYHGLALVVEGDLAPFRRFEPCGLDGEVMTSLEECGVPPEGRGRVRALVVEHLSAILVRLQGWV